MHFVFFCCYILQRCCVPLYENSIGRCSACVSLSWAATREIYSVILCECIPPPSHYFGYCPHVWYIERRNHASSRIIEIRILEMIWYLRNLIVTPPWYCLKKRCLNIFWDCRPQDVRCTCYILLRHESVHCNIYRVKASVIRWDPWLDAASTCEAIST